MLSNTDLHYIFLINRAMSLYHIGILHSLFFLQIGPTNLQPNLLFGHRNQIKKSSGAKHRRYPVTWVHQEIRSFRWHPSEILTLTPLIASISKRRCFVQRWKFTLLNNEFSIMQHFWDHYNKAPHNLMEKWIEIVASLNAKPLWGCI